MFAKAQAEKGKGHLVEESCSDSAIRVSMIETSLLFDNEHQRMDF